MQRHFIDVTNLVVCRSPGFIRAYLSTVHNGPIRNQGVSYARVYQNMGPQNVLCVWGNKDTVVNFPTQSLEFKRLLPGAGFIEVEGAGHSLVPEYPELCVEALTKFFLKGERLTDEEVKSLTRLYVAK
jgi:hypothetical protein